MLARIFNSLWIWTFVLGVVILGGTTVPPVNTSRSASYLYSILNSNNPSADVVFVGSSAIANAVDPVFLSENITNLTGREYNVEIVHDLGRTPHKFYSDILSYISKRGAPSILVLHIPLSSYGLTDTNPPSYIFEFKSLSVLDYNILLRSLSSFSNAYDRNPFLNWSLSGWLGVFEISLRKLSDYVHRAISVPSMMFEHTTRFSDDGVVYNRGRQPYGRLCPGCDYSDLGWLTEPSSRLRRSALSRHAERFPVDFDTGSVTDREVFSVIELIDRDIGPLVDQLIFTFVPHLGVDIPLSATALSSIEDLDNSEYVDSLNMFSLHLDNNYSDSAFRNANHLNYNGAHLFSVFWAQELANRLRYVGN